MSIPYRVDDGDQKPILEYLADIIYPFSERGDYESFEYIIHCEQDKDAFRPMSGMTARNFPLGRAYFVEQGPINDVGFGKIEFTRTFASIPKERIEGESVSWTLTIFTPTGPTSVRTDFAALATADVKYEYFTTKPNPIFAPRYYFSVAVPRNIIVQDSEVGIYKGKIYYRKTYYANAGGISLSYPV